MRTCLIAGNWKMHLTPAEGGALANTLRQRIGMRTDIEIVLCPPFVALPAVADALRGSEMKLGAQNVFWADSGAYTGQISPPMLVAVGCEYVILGHSETRGRFGTPDPTFTDAILRYFGENEATLNRKIRAVLPHGLKPILCVGETLEERQAGQTEKVIESQLQGALEGLVADELYELVIAYEPVWAIGTGQVCDAPEANRVCGWIRQWLAHHFEPELGEHVRILYGGSVKASNAHELLHQPEIDGALVGGASLNAEEFEQITYCARTH
ncbi:MAG: triose-phosphate isomerase [Fimbriimonadales bacterium]|mgnify:FL=1|jgi:triosephosphate isomerase|nr:triose-phosphate isomerase [Fimbriimonadales bacterium]GIV11986.1 MAG: triosephosphate isomerase [Fimbriimonadales bacterium]CUU10280.1 triosephosphate isomerase [Armatimonadetes bacterium GBS]CUU36780.1 triosephosphate isomerase [Armatimonadetes bacterium GXS]